MTIAGRVAIVPKGEWSQDINYDKLDLVTHNGNAFIAYKPSVNFEPVDGEVWMLVMESVSTEDVNKLKTDVESILNGTTPVEDSNKLGGKDASEYMEVAEYQPNTKTFLKTSILEKALELETNGVYDFILSGSSYSGGDLPNGNYAFSSATVLKRGSGINVILWGVTLSGGNYPPVMNFYNDTAWMGWKTLFTTDGGTLSDDITVDKGKTYLVDTRVGAKNVDCHIILLASSGGNIGLFDEKNGIWILKKDSNGKITIDSINNSPLKINTSDNTYNVIQFTRNNNSLGYIGMRKENNVDKLGFINANWSKEYDIFHTGNKPNGSYTGNGSATKRTINIGSFVGSAVMITGYGFTCIASIEGGGLYWSDTGTSVYKLTESQLSLSANGTLTIATTDGVNASGQTYKWWVL